MDSLVINGAAVPTTCPLFDIVREVRDIQDRRAFGRLILVFQDGKLVENEWCRKKRYVKPA